MLKAMLKAVLHPQLLAAQRTTPHLLDNEYYANERALRVRGRVFKSEVLRTYFVNNELEKPGYYLWMLATINGYVLPWLCPMILVLLCLPLIDTALLGANYITTSSSACFNNTQLNLTNVECESAFVHIDFYYWNITNPTEFMAGTQPPKLEEVGPYAYQVKSLHYNNAFDFDLLYNNHSSHSYIEWATTENQRICDNLRRANSTARCPSGDDPLTLVNRGFLIARQAMRSPIPGVDDDTFLVALTGFYNGMRRWRDQMVAFTVRTWPLYSNAWKDALFAPNPRPADPLSATVLQTLAARQFATMDLGNFTTPLSLVPGSGVQNLGQFEFSAFYAAWFAANAAAPPSMQVPPPFAASPALLATTYKQSLITLFNLFTLPPPGGFALTFPRIMAFSLTTPATYLTATMPELGLPNEGISFGIFAFLASNMFPSTAIPQPFAVQNFLRNMAGPHGNVLGALGTGPGGLVVTKTASQWLANPSGGWQDPVLQELLGADNPAATITMSFVDRTRTQLFETYGLVETPPGSGVYNTTWLQPRPGHWETHPMSAGGTVPNPGSYLHVYTGRNFTRMARRIIAYQNKKFRTGFMGLNVTYGEEATPIVVRETYRTWNGSLANKTVMVPYNTALGGTLPSGAFGGNIVILQLKRTYELWQSTLDRTVDVVYAGRTAHVLDTSSWGMGITHNMQTRVMHLTDDSLMACNVSDVYSAGWNASSRVARERCVGPDMLRGTWNATSQQVAKTIIALPGFHRADESLKHALGPDAYAYLSRPHTAANRNLHWDWWGNQGTMFAYGMEKKGWLYNQFWTNSSVRLPFEEQDGNVQGMYMPAVTLSTRFNAKADAVDTLTTFHNVKYGLLITFAIVLPAFTFAILLGSLLYTYATKTGRAFMAQRVMARRSKARSPKLTGEEVMLLAGNASSNKLLATEGSASGSKDAAWTLAALPAIAAGAVLSMAPME